MHKCIKCGKVYKDNDEKILKEGCECGSKLFIYIPEKKEKKKKTTEIKEMEFVELPLESVKVVEEGKFLLDIAKLFNEKVVVVKSKEGKYYLKIYLK
jgi:predicted  nucleic acid-binding Zn-ribbon protein